MGRLPELRRMADEFGLKLISIRDLTREEAILLLDTAEQMAATQHHSVKKLPTLQGKTVVNLFFEDSTRTRLSFEAAAKREGRAASAGLIAAKVVDSGNGQVGVLVEINAETDFVAKNQKFLDYAEQVLTAALDSGATDAEALAEVEVAGSTVKELTDGMQAVIGEKIVVRRVGRLEADKIELYLHRTNPDLPAQVAQTQQEPACQQHEDGDGNRHDHPHVLPHDSGLRTLLHVVGGDRDDVVVHGAEAAGYLDAAHLAVDGTQSHRTGPQDRHEGLTTRQDPQLPVNQGYGDLRRLTGPGLARRRDHLNM